ncbi:MAG TPA: hypothetical protein VGL72_10085 [Bryobacteraceae bacterium]|jgi:hypothetical protein
MRDNRLGGLALVIAAAAGVLVMAVHPVGHHGGGVMSRQDMEAMALMIRLVHGFALLTLPILFLGTLALTRYLDRPNRIALVALVFYGFALTALMIAACMDGFIGPTVMSKLVAGDPMTDARRLFLDYTWTINQSLAGVHGGRVHCDSPLVGGDLAHEVDVARAGGLRRGLSGRDQRCLSERSFAVNGSRIRDRDVCAIALAGARRGGTVGKSGRN